MGTINENNDPEWTYYGFFQEDGEEGFMDGSTLKPFYLYDATYDPGYVFRSLWIFYKTEFEGFISDRTEKVNVYNPSTGQSVEHECTVLEANDYGRYGLVDIEQGFVYRLFESDGELVAGIAQWDESITSFPYRIINGGYHNEKQ